MKKEVRAYNVLFPLWMFLLFPQAWLVAIPGNFVVDSLVLLFSMAILKMDARWLFYKSVILKVFLLGFLADLMASGALYFIMVYFKIGQMGDELYLTVPALLFAAALIFLFDYFISFRKSERALRVKLALIFAIATAPYTFLVPSSWIYNL